AGPLATTVSAGQAVLAPVQCSSGSQTEPPFGFPEPARHTTVLGWKPSGGQEALEPVQFSATSHTPAEARHSVVDGLKPSTGQIVLVPVQVSATSQSPAAARHIAPVLPAGC